MAGVGSGYGSVLNRVTTSTAGGGSNVFTPIAKVFNIDGPSLSRTDINVSHYGSTSQYNEYRPGMREGGVITLSLNFESSNTGQMVLFNSTRENGTTVYGTTPAVNGAFESNTIEEYTIDHSTAASAARWFFSGYVNAITPSQPLDDRKTWDVGIKVTGRPYRLHTT